MADPHSRAARTRTAGRSVRALMLVGAILAIVLGGLFMTRAASATPAAPTVPAASVAHAATATTVDHTQPAADGICGIPGIGDIGGLVGLCRGGAGLQGTLNNICSPSTPQPELASSGIDSMISVPGGQKTGNTLYDNYGLSGQYWAATGLQCSDMTALIGNNVASMVFDMAKSLDRVTITVYQSAAGSNILAWLSGSVDSLISALGKAIYFPFLAPVVIIGAIWLAWQGLIRKRATRTIEGTVWMVIACAAAIWLIGRPTDFTNVGTTVSNGVTSVMNTAFANLPATNGVGSNCLPVAQKDPQSVTSNFSFASNTGIVDENANELWSVLVCKPWLLGELGSTQYAAPGTPAAQTNVVNVYGRQLLWAQAIANNEPSTPEVNNAKMQTYNGIAAKLKSTNPAVYSLFQGNQWTNRLEIGFSALFAAVAAGLLVLLIALTLIILKLGFLLLLVAGPFFLIVGVHPGFGRVIAVRWFEMIVGVLLKQVAVALVLSILLYCYALIMGTSDQELSWALKIMMIALVTVAVFIYRKPFQHMFSSVGYGMLGSSERAEVSWRESALGFRRVTGTAAGIAVPGFGAARAGGRWARRPAADSGASAAAAAGGGTSGTGTGAGAVGPEGLSGMPTADSHSTARQWPDAGVASGRPAPPLPLPPQNGAPAPAGGSAGWARGGATGSAGSGTRGPAQPPARRTGSAASPPVSQSRTAPPARPAPGSGWPGAAAPVRSGESKPNGAAGGAAKPPAAPFWSRSRRSK